MKAIQIRATYWATNGHGVSVPLFNAGEVLPAYDEGALRMLALNNADEIDVPDAPADAAPEAAAPAPEDAAPAPAAPARGKRAAG